MFRSSRARAGAYSLFCAFLQVVAPGMAAAQNLQEQAQNPIASLISVPFQNNVNFGVGTEDRTQYVLNFQPVVPVALSDDWNLIFRPITPIIHKPVLFPGDDSAFGLGDLNPQLFFVPSETYDTPLGGLTWGVGPTFQLPTATDDSLGTGKWSAGPAAVVFLSSAPWTYGALVSHLWSFAGDGDRSDVSQLVIQPFVNYNLSDGWSVGTSPIISANWEAGDGEVWTLPLGGGVTKLFAIGRQPMSLSLNSYYNVVNPDLAADWQLQVQFKLLFPR